MYVLLVDVATWQESAIGAKILNFYKEEYKPAYPLIRLSSPDDHHRHRLRRNLSLPNWPTKVAYHPIGETSKQTRSSQTKELITHRI